jgi:hypothetical protein
VSDGVVFDRRAAACGVAYRVGAQAEKAETVLVYGRALDLIGETTSASEGIVVQGQLLLMRRADGPDG